MTCKPGKDACSLRKMASADDLETAVPLRPAADSTALNAWRRRKRAVLLAARIALPAEIHRQKSSQVLERLRAVLARSSARLIGFYWPFRGEIDVLPLLLGVIAEGASAALPVVVGPGQPLQFRRWMPGDSMLPGAYNIPHPHPAAAVQPDILLVPLVGFDSACYRLGYGGGYYDRTLRRRVSPPLTIGVGFELSRLETIYPQPYDVPLDFVLTECETIERKLQAGNLKVKDKI